MRTIAVRPSRQERVAAGVAVLAVALAIAACGGSSSSGHSASFKTGYASARSQLRQSSQAIGVAIQRAGSQSDGQIRSTFGGLASRWQTELSQLETLKPPSSVSAEFNTLTGAASRVESDLNAVISAAATHSYSAAQQAGASMVQDITTARQADAAISQKLRLS